jgi:hypothetical protein
VSTALPFFASDANLLAWTVKLGIRLRDKALRRQKPQWTADNASRPSKISGRLAAAELPHLYDQHAVVSRTTTGDLSKLDLAFLPVPTMPLRWGGDHAYRRKQVKAAVTEGVPKQRRCRNSGALLSAHFYTCIAQNERPTPSWWDDTQLSIATSATIPYYSAEDQAIGMNGQDVRNFPR